ncbi:MAG TPA: glycosyltransferase family 2 protein [Dehalococcoidia bacterium]|nr:glycosyltransferase family 2 protein [Dehalococcoidia bacterium]
MSKPSVAIILLNWNGLADTRACLESLQKIDYPEYRVIVVDNGSAGDEAQALRQQFAGYAQVLESGRNYGFAGGCNIGIRQALEQKTDYVLLLNNDTVVATDFLTRMVEAAQSLPDLAAVCPKTYFYGQDGVIYSTGGKVNLWTATSRAIGRGQRDNGQLDSLAMRDYADGVCMLIPRQALERVGLLDEDYFAYWEETDWCFRARELGLRCYYVPSARIWHKAERSLFPDSDFYYLFRRNAFLFVRKRGRPYHLISALLLYLFWYGPRYLVRHPSAIKRLLAEAKAVAWHLGNRAGRRPLM